MSTETTNTSKLREFVDELKRLKVEVVRPDINECFADFKTIREKDFIRSRSNQKCWQRSNS